MSIVGWIVFGALAGWVASFALGDKRRGCLPNMVIGILGAFFGGFIYRIATKQKWSFAWDWPSFGVAVLGSLALLLIISLVSRGRSNARR